MVMDINCFEIRCLLYTRSLCCAMTSMHAISSFSCARSTLSSIIIGCFSKVRLDVPFRNSVRVTVRVR